MDNTEIDALVLALNTEAKAALLKLAQTYEEKPEAPKSKRKKCKYQYHTVLMHYKYLCRLCGKVFTETHPFDILLEGEPKEYYEKEVSVLSCKFCEEELMKKEKESIVSLVLSFVENMKRKGG